MPIGKQIILKTKIMKKQIWKFEISWNKTTIEMPEESEILAVQKQNEKPCIWALVNPKNEKEIRHFEIYGTGQDINCDIGVERKYINTFQLNEGTLVFHIFECINSGCINSSDINNVMKTFCPVCGSKYYDEDNNVKRCQDCITV